MPEYPVSAGVARQYGGLSAPTRTAAQIEAADDTISTRADTLVFSDDLYFNPDAQTVDDFLYRRTVECIGGTCYFAATADTGIQAVSIQALATEPSSPNLRIMPIGQRHGVAVAQATDHGVLDSGERYSAQSYGGWLTYSAFAWEGVEYDDGIGQLFSYSYGQGTQSNPVGIATWSGIVTGVDISVTETFGNVVQGQASIVFDPQGRTLPTVQGPLVIPTVDVAFTQMVDLDASTRRNDIRWRGLTTENGSFSGFGIEGRFYGPAHEEVGGTFEKSQILGAFGASRP